ncbi:NAD(P)/FAD-dependent oxidoreductase [Pseudoalteromonas luteoviolacea]|uniref:FAD/NAD(P)-dependent oxidoreductase n=1 Tax=Pseudoalteromonas luteoviolacea TaxID=43657 RepID=UPI00114E6A35|nr:NAD(P)/FAD-dependent oxidoreductase [Pseudoalteromonas luteoviolacea]TQF72062.1 FAD/NAD(P)-binding oxidoreductase [Pseudoalteromonas luteoviolacea]
MANASPVVIVGGGPSGTAAAAMLGKYQISSIIVEEAPKIGGVIYRGPLRKTQSLPHLDDNLQRAMSALRTRYENNRSFIDLKLQTRVLGPEGKQQLLLSENGQLTTQSYNELILATGCHERSIPFPGWQLPGVMLLGGVQLQIKSGLVRPGARMALVGTGPLLPLVACQLHKAGVNVVGVYEASSFNKLAKEAVALLNKPKLTLSGLSMMGYLKKHQIPFYYGHGIVNAQGSNKLERITVAPYDEQWQADHRQSQSVEVDAIGVGYGFVARTQLAMLLGVEHKYTKVSGYIPKLDDNFLSSQDNLYVVGDSSGLLGADAAICEGQIAAIDIALKRGAVTTSVAQKEKQKVMRKHARIARFRFGFDRFSERQNGLLNLAQDDTVVCRCEQATKKQLDDAIKQGVKDLTTLKMRTRIGMGDCQGKTCSSYALDLLHQAGHKQNSKTGVIKPRFPLDPIPFTFMEETFDEQI